MDKKTDNTILAVDDSPENLDLIKNILEPFYTVKVATSGSLAVHIAQKHNPDLILLDIMLGDANGFDICHLLKSDDKTRNTPVIFLTAKRSEADEVQGFKIGGSDYITKPFSPAIVLARVRTQIQLKAKTDLLEKLASLDGLTEIPNRRAFDVALDRQFNQAQRTRTRLSLLVLDIDFFKLFNDYYGHPIGDDCLRRVARALTVHTQRPGDLVARLGGEEFAILLPNTDIDGAIMRAEQYRLAVERLKIPHAVNSPLPHISVSIGVGTIEPHSDGHAAELFQVADAALYQAKHSGRNCVARHFRMA
ncbi:MULTISPECIES: diguanylate cyclase [Methylomonas]|uniref:diguanylate cyclase n=1 Tax=Methylomonas TaxID=416 RepID=UPI00123246D7|nr:diguanylate cyclase [Methylomonas rhizoryzae]